MLPILIFLVILSLLVGLLISWRVFLVLGSLSVFDLSDSARVDIQVVSMAIASILIIVIFIKCSLSYACRHISGLQMILIKRRPSTPCKA